MSYINRSKHLSLTFLNHPTGHSRDSMCPKKKTNRPISYPYTKIFVMLDLKMYLGLLLQDHTLMMPLKWQMLKVNFHRAFWRHLNLKADYTCILCLDKESIKLSIWYILVEANYEILVNLLRDLTEHFWCFQRKNFRPLRSLDVKISNGFKNFKHVLCKMSWDHDFRFTHPTFSVQGFCQLGPKSAEFFAQNMYFFVCGWVLQYWLSSCQSPWKISDFI